MIVSIHLATMADAKQLLAWRNDERTRMSSHSSEIISLTAHRDWLSQSLKNPARKIYIGSYQGQDIGSVRSDFNNGVYELSWMLAANARGKGLAKPMIQTLIDITPKPMSATIKKENVASQKIAQYMGFTLKEEDIEGVLYFYLASEREAIILE